jgi:uncharacterized membrane protein YphA (DoxX/SURF4 family)
MLSVFPGLLAFGLFAPLLLRIVTGFVFLRFGWSKLSSDKENKSAFFESIGWKPGSYFAFGFGVLEIIIGCSLIAGFYTQISALAATLILLGALAIKRKHSEQFESSTGFLFLLLIISISLLVSGAGLFAFDLPL